MAREDCYTNYEEYVRVKNHFKNIPLDFDCIVGKDYREEKWSLPEGKELLFRQQIEADGKAYNFHYYVYPLAYSLLNFMNIIKTKDIKTKKEEEYILSKQNYGDLLTTLLQLKCAQEELLDNEPPYYMERYVKKHYPEAYREDEGIYWDILADKLIKEYVSLGFGVKKTND